MEEGPINHWKFKYFNKTTEKFEDTVNINYRLPIKVYYRICTLRHIRIEINHGNLNMLGVLTWIGSMIRVDFGSISEAVYIDIILNKIIER
jgi:hypothetical protein